MDRRSALCTRTARAQVGESPMLTSMRIPIGAFLFALGVVQGCTPAEAAPAAPTAATGRPGVAMERDGRPNKDCWWVRVGGSESVAVWVSPRLAGEVDGGFRFINLFFHDPTCARKMVVFGNAVRLSSSDPVSIGNASIELRAVPVGGKTWAAVAVREDLNVTLKKL